MIFIERLEMFFVVLPSGISGTIHVDAISHIFIQPASSFFLRIQFSNWQRADLIIPDDAGILCSVFNGFRNRDSETVKNPCFLKELKIRNEHNPVSWLKKTGQHFIMCQRAWGS